MDFKLFSPPPRKDYTQTQSSTGPYAVKMAQCADVWIFTGAGALPLLPSLADPLGCLTESTRLGPQEQKTMGLTPCSLSFLT